MNTTITFEGPNKLKAKPKTKKELRGGPNLILKTPNHPSGVDIWKCEESKEASEGNPWTPRKYNYRRRQFRSPSI